MLQYARALMASSEVTEKDQVRDAQVREKIISLCIESTSVL